MIEAMLLGAATGMRSTAGLGAVVLTRGPTLPSALRGRAAPPVAVLAISSELVIDKLPTTPSRLEPPGLIARVMHDARAALGRRWPDAIVGAAEDVIALGTAGFATRWATR